MATPNINEDDQLDPRRSWNECCKRHSKFIKLRGFPLPRDDLWHEAAVKRDFSQLDEFRQLPDRLTKANYVPTMRTLLKMERAYGAIHQRKFDMFQREVPFRRPLGSCRDLSMYYFIRLNEGSDVLPSLNVGDYVILSNRSSSRISEFVSKKDGYIISKERRPPRSTNGGPWDISFIHGITKCREDELIEQYAIKPEIMCRLFQDESKLVAIVDDLPVANIACDSTEANERMKLLNPYQQRAVMNIMMNTSWPKPYILLGPPGTGKTHILAEAIAQIYVRQPESRILYCANSNTCVNQIVDKLWKFSFIRSHEIVRMSAGESLQTVGWRRIILTTILESWVMRGGVCEFDYVIVDEAGHALEWDILRPMSLLCRTGCLVLAGDPKQLDVEVLCDQARMHFLGKSLLERLLTTLDVYKRDKATGQYDYKYITKLPLSYRCDQRIMAISNRLFYDSELLCANETPKSILKMMNITNPLQFIPVEGRNVQPANSTSWRNDMEAGRCVDLIVRLYEMGLTPDQIGVISPYTLQTKLIYQKLKDRLKSLSDLMEERFREVMRVKWEEGEKSAGDSSTQENTLNAKRLKLDEASYTKRFVCIRRSDEWLCKMGSVHAFQGDEREVIIISTVKTPSSARKDVINNPRHFNVAISRAKWLVIVIGHKSVLEDRLSIWREFLENASVEITG